MKLIGMYGSPYVRRVALFLRLLKIPYEHQAVSVFGGMNEFRKINPVLKAPTLICDDGTVLMDSTLIIQYLSTLGPTQRIDNVLAYRILGLGLMACEKAGQLVLERAQRPPEKQHAPWVERVSSQLVAACEGLEAELSSPALPEEVRSDSLVRITTTVGWTFTQVHVPQVVQSTTFPLLAALGREMEQTPDFLAVPVS